MKMKMSRFQNFATVLLGAVCAINLVGCFDKSNKDDSPQVSQPNRQPNPPNPAAVFDMPKFIQWGMQANEALKIKWVSANSLNRYADELDKQSKKFATSFRGTKFVREDQMKEFVDLVQTHIEFINSTLDEPAVKQILRQNRHNPAALNRFYSAHMNHAVAIIKHTNSEKVGEFPNKGYSPGRYIRTPMCDHLGRDINRGNQFELKLSIPKEFDYHARYFD